MDLSIIIVNWNSVNYLRKCIASIFSNTKGLDFEVVVVDNASYDGCGQMLNAEFPAVRFIQSTKNVGFAGANNLGFAHATGDNLLFLNPDTEVVGPAIKIMHSHLLSIPDAGAMGCKLLNSDLSLQTSCIQPFPTLLNQLLDIEYLKMRTPGLKWWGIKPLFANVGEAEEVQVISGACIMVKREVFEKVKGFSEDYFMYTEDIDLCYKISHAGYKNYYIGKTTVIHHGRGSSRSRESTFSSAAILRESVFTFLEKTRGKIVARCYKRAMMFSAAARLIILKTLIMIIKRESLEFALKKWEMVFRWASGLEKPVLGIPLK